MNSLLKIAAGPLAAAALILTPAAACADQATRNSGPGISETSDQGASPGLFGPRTEPSGDAMTQPPAAQLGASEAAQSHLDQAKASLDEEDLRGAALHIRQASAVVKAEMARANATEKPALEDAAAELERIAAEAETGKKVDEEKVEETFAARSKV
ncbi:MAG: hypothetical protein K8I02_00140, partial [Candidatus Methylomirabilis sp.]|nr:hypothetical protein [Deltaproteobacteria bacterium]